MADSTYSILEYRAICLPHWSELYIRITDPTDFIPIGGWYKTRIPATAQTLDELRRAILTQSFLTEWDRGNPPEA